MAINFTCIIVDDELHAIELLKDKLAHLYKDIHITGTFTAWEDALDALRRQPADLLLLDISLPGKNAFEMLKLLPNLKCEIIFVTAHENFALDTFAFFTSGYLLKPVDDAELCAAINIATERIKHKKLAQQNAPVLSNFHHKIGVPSGKGVSYFDINDIIYFEGIKSYTRVITINTEMLSSYSIGKYKELLEGLPFYPVHRSYIVNLNYITRYEATGILTMINKKEIPVSRGIREDFLRLFSGFQPNMG